MKVQHCSYVGKTMFVGIDVHKKTYAVSVRGADLPKPMRITNLPADPKALATRLKSLFDGAEIRTVYEAGFSGLVLHRELERHGIKNIVVNPSSIPVESNNLVKTDKRDADKMSLFLSLGVLRGNRIPSEKEELSRLYQRTRRQLVRNRVIFANQIKSKLMQFGFWDSEDDRVISDSLLKEVEQIEMPLELKVTIGSLISMYRSITIEIKNLNAKMAEQAQADQQVESVYRSVPGFGAISARILATELGDMSQFQNQRQLYSFTGLTPMEFSSGGKEHKGSITRQGNSELRAILVEAAWRGIRKDPVLKNLYDHLRARRGGKRAIVAVARQLIGRVRGCFLSGRLYELNYV